METVNLIDNDIFSPYGVQKHVMFDPLNNFKNLNDEKMNDRLTQKEYKNMKPWRTLTEIIAIPVVLLALLVVVKINIIVKILLIFMLVLQIIVSTCLISYLSKNTTSNTLANENHNDDDLKIKTEK